MLKGIVGLLQLHKKTVCEEAEADYGAFPYQQEIICTVAFVAPPSGA
jgi:hypothetical protein